MKTPQFFYLCVCKLLLTQQLCKGILCVTWRKELSWMGCGVDVPHGGAVPDPRARRGPGRPAGKGGPCPLQEGRKGFLCPSLLSNWSWEFVFALAKYVPTVMQGNFSSALSVSVWPCLNFEKSKMFIILSDSNAIMVISNL